MVFAGDIYYPLGGMSDYHGSFELLEAAIEEARSQASCMDWAHVFDSISERIVWKAERPTQGSKVKETPLPQGVAPADL